MAKVEIYTWRTCPFCVRAKALLDGKGVTYTEYSVDGDEAARDAMAARGDGRRSVPQVYINDQHMGDVMTSMPSSAPESSTCFWPKPDWGR